MIIWFMLHLILLTFVLTVGVISIARIVDKECGNGTLHNDKEKFNEAFNKKVGIRVVLMFLACLVIIFSAIVFRTPIGPI